MGSTDRLVFKSGGKVYIPRPSGRAEREGLRRVRCPDPACHRTRSRLTDMVQHIHHEPNCTSRNYLANMDFYHAASNLCDIAIAANNISLLDLIRGLTLDRGQYGHANISIAHVRFRFILKFVSIIWFTNVYDEFFFGKKFINIMFYNSLQRRDDARQPLAAHDGSTTEDSEVEEEEPVDAWTDEDDDDDADYVPPTGDDGEGGPPDHQEEEHIDDPPANEEAILPGGVDRPAQDQPQQQQPQQQQQRQQDLIDLNDFLILPPQQQQAQQQQLPPQNVAAVMDQEGPAIRLFDELVRLEVAAQLTLQQQQQQQLEHERFQQALQQLQTPQQPLVPQQEQIPQQNQQAGGGEQIIAPQMVLQDAKAEQNLLNMFAHMVGQQQQEQRTMFDKQFSAFFDLIGRQGPPPQ